MEELQIQPLALNSILVGLELDAPDKGILRFVKTLHEEITTREVHFLHIVPDHRPISLSVSGEISEEWATDLELKNDLKEHINALLRTWYGPVVPQSWQTDIVEGNPLEVLLDSAATLEADAVIIGSHADHSQHMVDPPRLARKLPVDAFIVPDKATGEITNILVPIDFSGYSIRALHKAIALRESLRGPATLTVVHVYELPNFSLYRTSRTPDQWESMISKAKLEALDIFLYSNAKAYRDSIQTAVVKKDLPGLPQYILNYAETHGTDLLVMGAKGHSPVDLLLMGSVTEKVIRETDSIPVWVVR